MQNYQPVQDAELPACPRCGIVCLVRGMICLSRLLNFQPVVNADFHLPVWCAELRVPACLVCGVMSTCLSGMRSYEYLPVWYAEL
jgi:hypothetical protein